MRVAVLGGGLQGCCIALALAARGAHVVLIDRNAGLLSRAAVANEGKIHLGYMYAGDRTLNTAKMMVRGALAFGPFMSRHLDLPQDRLAVSVPAVYLVHRESQRPPDEIGEYFAAVHALIADAMQGRPDAYFGMEIGPVPRPWPDCTREAEFDPERILAAFQTPEVAVDPVELAKLLRTRLDQAPTIDLRLNETVTGVRSDTDGMHVDTAGASGSSRDRFDHVVNALWDGRLAIDATLGLRPQRPWMHRLKYGVSFRPAPDASATAIGDRGSRPFRRSGELPRRLDLSDLVSALRPRALRTAWLLPIGRHIPRSRSVRESLPTRSTRSLRSCPPCANTGLQTSPTLSCAAAPSWHGATRTSTTRRASCTAASRSASTRMADTTAWTPAS